MFVGIHHTINDAKKWKQATESIMGKIEAGTQPVDLKPMLYIPATNQKSTFCVWEGKSIDSVKKFIDHESGNAARNDYFEVDTKSALGLPTVAVGKK